METAETTLIRFSNLGKAAIELRVGSQDRKSSKIAGGNKKKTMYQNITLKNIISHTENFETDMVIMF